MTRQRTSLTAIWILFLTLLSVSNHLYAQTKSAEYPNKPIRFVVPFVAGGPTDIQGRMHNALANPYSSTIAVALVAILVWKSQPKHPLTDIPL
jgi:tripartite-type tricarboxylate transporter receptor subunit TctC